jgi:hypothetical protein
MTGHAYYSYDGTNFPHWRSLWVGYKLQIERWSDYCSEWLFNHCMTLPEIRRAIRRIQAKKITFAYDWREWDYLLADEDAYHDAQNSADGVEMRKRT